MQLPKPKITFESTDSMPNDKIERGNRRKRFERKPNFDMQAGLSKDGKYWIIKKIETWILPRRYLDVISENFGKSPTLPATAHQQIQCPVTAVRSKNTKKGK